MNTKKKFDCVKMMRDLRDKINSDIENMTTKQIIAYIRKGRVDFEKEMSRR